MKTAFFRSTVSALLTLILLASTTLLALAQDEVITGLGPGSSGWHEYRDDYNANLAHLSWQQVPWSYYNDCNGETHAAMGDLDGGGQAEVVLGLGACSYGWFEVRDDSSTGYSHLAWLQVPWTYYDNLNGPTWPAVGDLDGNGTSEMVVGLGKGAGGWFEVRDNAFGGYGHLAWLQVPWGYYNNINGETHPALGDIDGDGRAEIIVGLGKGAGGWFAIFDDSVHGYAFLGWRQIQWSYCNNVNGTTWPASGDVYGLANHQAAIVMGLGSGCGGWTEVFGGTSTGIAHQTWLQVPWSFYNNANGETHPAIADFDNGGIKELLLGLGPNSFGWFEGRDDGTTGFAHVGWWQVNWSSYDSRSDAQTWPAGADNTPSVASASATEVKAAETQKEPGPRTPVIVPASTDGPPVNTVNASKMDGPSMTEAQYAGPDLAQGADAKSGPPITTDVYAGPPQTNEFFAGPDAASKLYLPFVAGQ